MRIGEPLSASLSAQSRKHPYYTNRPPIPPESWKNFLKILNQSTSNLGYNIPGLESPQSSPGSLSSSTYLKVMMIMLKVWGSVALK